MNPFSHTGLSISDSLKSVRKSVLIYETIIYQEEDLRWVELAVCMRNAGLPIESLIEYQRLFRAGDSTIPARLELLNEQMDILQKQKEQMKIILAVP